MNVCFTCFLSDLNVLFFVVGFVLGCLPGLGIADDYGQAVGVLSDVSCWHILVVGENLSLPVVVPLIIVIFLVGATWLGVCFAFSASCCRPSQLADFAPQILAGAPCSLLVPCPPVSACASISGWSSRF